MIALRGTKRLARLVVRRDRVRLVVWMVGLTAVTVASAASLLDVYPDQRSIDAYGLLFGDNPALVAFAGPGYGLDDPTIGAILVNETQLWGAIAVALMSIFLVVRHTRAEEDAERADLVMSMSVGHHASLVAAVGVVALAELVVAVACAAGVAALGYPIVGSVALAGSWLAVGYVFIGLAAVAAQLAGTARGALTLGSSMLAVSFVVRAIGDITGGWLVWLSPIGWAQAVRAFASERWWTLGLCIAFTVVVIAASLALADRRDLGSGLAPPRPGPERASSFLASPLGFAWHQQRGALLGWVLALAATGAVYGSITDDVEALLLDNPQLAEVLASLRGADLTDAFLGTALVMLGIMATGWVVAAGLGPHRDETSGRLELVAVAPLPRGRWLAGAALVAAVGAVAVVVAAGLGLGSLAALTLGDTDQILRCLTGAVQVLPAVLVVLGATVLLVGAVPRFATAAWGFVALVALVGFLGDALDLPSAVRHLSPFEYVPAVPAEDASPGAAVVSLLLAIVLCLVGVLAVDRRDLTST